MDDLLHQQFSDDAQLLPGWLDRNFAFLRQLDKCAMAVSAQLILHRQSIHKQIWNEQKAILRNKSSHTTTNVKNRFPKGEDVLLCGTQSNTYDLPNDSDTFGSEECCNSSALSSSTVDSTYTSMPKNKKRKVDGKQFPFFTGSTKTSIQHEQIRIGIKTTTEMSPTVAGKEVYAVDTDQSNVGSAICKPSIYRRSRTMKLHHRVNEVQEGSNISDKSCDDPNDNTTKILKTAEGIKSLGNVSENSKSESTNSVHFSNYHRNPSLDCESLKRGENRLQNLLLDKIATVKQTLCLVRYHKRRLRWHHKTLQSLAIESQQQHTKCIDDVEYEPYRTTSEKPFEISNHTDDRFQPKISKSDELKMRRRSSLKSAFVTQNTKTTHETTTPQQKAKKLTRAYLESSNFSKPTVKRNSSEVSYVSLEDGSEDVPSSLVTSSSELGNYSPKSNCLTITATSQNSRNSPSMYLATYTNQVDTNSVTHHSKYHHSNTNHSPLLLPTSEICCNSQYSFGTSDNLGHATPQHTTIDRVNSIYSSVSTTTSDPSFISKSSLKKSSFSISNDSPVVSSIASLDPFSINDIYTEQDKHQPSDLQKRSQFPIDENTSDELTTNTATPSIIWPHLDFIKSSDSSFGNNCILPVSPTSYETSNSTVGFDTAHAVEFNNVVPLSGKSQRNEVVQTRDLGIPGRTPIGQTKLRNASLSECFSDNDNTIISQGKRNKSRRYVTKDRHYRVSLPTPENSHNGNKGCAKSKVVSKKQKSLIDQCVPNTPSRNSDRKRCLNSTIGTSSKQDSINIIEESNIYAIPNRNGLSNNLIAEADDWSGRCPLCGNGESGKDMVACDSCDEWFHFSCVEYVETNEDWYCYVCINNKVNSK